MQIELKYSESNMQSDRGYGSIDSTVHMKCTNGNLPTDFNFNWRFVAIKCELYIF